MSAEDLYTRTAAAGRGAFWSSKNNTLLDAAPLESYDRLHPEARETESNAALTETQYFNFSIPEERINAFCYLWYHPNLGTVTGGVMVSRGIHHNTLQCDLFDIMTYAGDDCFTEDLRSYRLENGYQVETLEPLRRHRVRYADEQRSNLVDVTFEALTDPVVWSTGKHFEQPMRARGCVVLRGEEFTVDGYGVRDRSWGQLRQEHMKSAPPMDWMNGVFGPDFSFGCTAFDDPGSNPDWAGVLEIPGSGDPVTGGWVYRDGTVRPIVTARKKTVRDLDRMFPESVEMELVDSAGVIYGIRGEVISAAPWKPWHNIDGVIGLARWECEGRVGHGDFQQFMWNDYARLFTGAAARRSTTPA